MRIKSTIAAASVLGAILLFSSNKNGTGLSTTAPGEAHTCTQPTCHGAGNGQNTSGGLADSAGPGSLTYTTSPAMTNNQYTLGQLYHVTVKVKEIGKKVFGLSFEALDNTGQTNLKTDNTIGTLTITNTARTRFSKAFGTGRKNVTHLTDAGFMNDSSTYTFDWTAPQTGTVNFYYSGVAGNHDGLESAADNCYTGHTVLTPSISTGTVETNNKISVFTYPNPAKENITVAFNNPSTQQVNIQLYSLEGKLVKSFNNSVTQAGSCSQNFSTADIANGVYILQISGEGVYSHQKLVIE